MYLQVYSSLTNNLMLLIKNLKEMLLIVNYTRMRKYVSDFTRINNSLFSKQNNAVKVIYIRMDPFLLIDDARTVKPQGQLCIAN